jgi:hypothetical protein
LSDGVLTSHYFPQSLGGDERDEDWHWSGASGYLNLFLPGHTAHCIYIRFIYSPHGALIGVSNRMSYIGFVGMSW